jgi:hypothetical protein
VLTVRPTAVLASISTLTAAVGKVNQPGLLTPADSASRLVAASVAAGLAESDTSPVLTASLWP